MPKKLLFKLAYRSFLQPWYRWRRGMTLGTRTCVFDAGDRVLLVQHSYSDGWVLPGGGVEHGETIYESAIREVWEEARVVVDEKPTLVGFVNNDSIFPGDHVAILTVRKFRQEAFVPNSEIAAAEFFAVSDLPQSTTEGTRRRIAEVSQGLPVSPRW